jgi:hypothetical protein
LPVGCASYKRAAQHDAEFAGQTFSFVHKFFFPASRRDFVAHPLARLLRGGCFLVAANRKSRSGKECDEECFIFHGEEHHLTNLQTPWGVTLPRISGSLLGLCL